MNPYNSDITEEQQQKLRELFPEVFNEDKIDWDKLRTTLGADIELGEKYGLSWKGKSNVFAKIQEKTVSTLHPQPEESVDWDTTQNMFIEGDNLEVLKVLHKAYYGKIKMIYIDPPYNTGNDFVYNDDFKKTRREQAMEEGAIDEEGNVTREDGLRVNTGGHKHSNWLDMMYPRLFLARNLLRQDGVIFVSIDDNEVHNLRLMMNEIFGEENFLTTIVWKKRNGPPNDRTIAYTHEYIVAYARSLENIVLYTKSRTQDQNARYRNLDNHPKGPWVAGDLMANVKGGRYVASLYFPIINPKTGEEHYPSSNGNWRYNENKIQDLLKRDEIYFGEDGKGRPKLKRFLSDVRQGTTWPSIWDFTEYNQHGTKQIETLLGNLNIFDTPKPVGLMKQLVQLGSAENDIVMDFFGGSGTLAQGVAEQNMDDNQSRKFLVIQLPETTNESSVAYKAGYTTIAQIARKRIRRAGAKISKGFADKVAARETPLDLGLRSYVLGDSNFKKWNELVTDPEQIKQQTLDSLNPLENDASGDDLLTEILLKRGISPLVEIEKHDDFVFIPSETLAISLCRHMTEQLFAAILAKSPSQIILLDQAFRDDVNLKTNLILQTEKQNISVEVL